MRLNLVQSSHDGWYGQDARIRPESGRRRLFKRASALHNGVLFLVGLPNAFAGFYGPREPSDSGSVGSRVSSNHALTTPPAKATMTGATRT